MAPWATTPGKTACSKPWPRWRWCWEDESGDANRFAREPVQRCVQDGVQFRLSRTVTALRQSGGRIDHVEATDAEGCFLQLQADAYVLAMGSL